MVHLVSTIVPGSSYADFENEFHQVIFPTIQIMHICTQNNIRFVYFSSGGTVYGNPIENRPFKETDPMRPISYYGWLKQMMENSIHFIHRTTGLKYLILRPSNPYGPGQNLFGKQGFISVCLGKILTGQTIEIWGEGNSIRDYIYIDDLAEYCCELFESDVFNRTINIGSGTGYSQNQILKFIRAIVDTKFSVKYEAARKVDVSNMVLDVTQLNQLVSHTPLTITEGIRKFWKIVKNV